MFITLFIFFYRYTKPQTFADCIGNELPLGWEEGYDGQIGPYYINHVNRKYKLYYKHFLLVLGSSKQLRS